MFAFLAVFSSSSVWFAVAFCLALRLLVRAPSYDMVTVDDGDAAIDIMIFLDIVDVAIIGPASVVVTDDLSPLSFWAFFCSFAWINVSGASACVLEFIYFMECVWCTRIYPKSVTRATKKKKKNNERWKEKRCTFYESNCKVVTQNVFVFCVYMRCVYPFCLTHIRIIS